MHSRSTTTSTLRRCLAPLAAVITLLAATVGTALAASAIGSMTEVASSNGNMGSTATEWSGATYNASRNVILTVDDEHNAYEFALLADGSIDGDAPVRELDIQLDTSDFEGVAWITSDRYAIVSEDTGRAYVVDVPISENVIDNGDLVTSFDVGGPDGNTGTEGIGVGSDGSFYVTDEMPASVSKYTPAGFLLNTVLLPELGDATGVVAAEDDSVIVISHESAKAVHYEIDWTEGTRTQIGEIDLSAFSQLEGVAIIGNEQLHFFGELKGGQTYSHMVGEIVPEPEPEFDPLDVDCSGTVNVVDALMISRVEVGTREPDPACGAGDANADGITNVIDALLIAQCEVGIHNMACPEV